MLKLRCAVALVSLVLLAGCPPGKTDPMTTVTPVRITSLRTQPLPLVLGETTDWQVRITTPDGSPLPKYKMLGAVSDPGFDDLGQNLTFVTQNGTGDETISIQARDYEAAGYADVRITACPDKPYPQELECDTFILPSFVYGGAADSIEPLQKVVSVVVGEKRPLDALVLAAPKKSRSHANRRERSHQLPRWVSANAAVARVTPEGLVEGVSLGTTTLTVSAGTHSETVSVTVAPGAMHAPPDGQYPGLDNAPTWAGVGGTALDDRSYPYLLGWFKKATDPNGNLAYLMLAEWTGSGFGASLIEPPDEPSTPVNGDFVKAGQGLFVDARNRLYVVARTYWGVVLYERDANAPGSAWRRRELPRMQTVHIEFDPQKQKDALELMKLEGLTDPVSFAVMERPQQGVFIAAASYEQNRVYPAPYQCVENLRLFTVTDATIEAVDVMTQRHAYIGSPPQETCFSDLIEPTAGGLEMLTVLPGETAPRLLYAAGRDYSPNSNMRLPTYNGQYFGGPTGLQEFSKQNTGWAHAELVPDGGIDVKGRIVNEVRGAARIRGTPADPQGVLFAVPDPFFGGDATLAVEFMRSATGALTQVPITINPPLDAPPDPFFNNGRVYVSQLNTSRYGRDFAANWVMSTRPRREPTFTNALNSEPGQRLGTARVSETAVQPLMFDSSGALVVSAGSVQQEVYSAAVSAPAMSRGASVQGKTTFVIGTSIFVADYGEYRRSDDHGATFQDVRTITDGFSPAAVVTHSSGALIGWRLGTDLQRQFSPNFPQGAALVSLPLAPSTDGRVPLFSQNNDTDFGAYVDGSSFVVVSRLDMMVQGGTATPEWRILVERFGLDGVRTAATWFTPSFAPTLDSSLVLALNGGVLVSGDRLAFVGWGLHDTRVYVLNLTDGTVARTDFTEERADADARRVTATGRLLKRADGRLLLATVERSPLPSAPMFIRQQPSYRMSSADLSSWSDPVPLAPPAAQAQPLAWGLNPIDGSLIVALSDTFVDDHYNAPAVYDGAKPVVYLKRYTLP